MAKNKKALPLNLPGERCPECLKKEKDRADQTMRVLQQTGLLPD